MAAGGPSVITRRRVTVTVSEDGQRFFLRGWRAVELAREAGLEPVYNGVTGWTADAARLGTLLAYLDHRHVLVTVEDPAQGSLLDDGGAP